MAFVKDRTRIFVHGLGRFEVLETSPTPATYFSDVGYLKSATINRDILQI